MSATTPEREQWEDKAAKLEATQLSPSREALRRLWANKLAFFGGVIVLIYILTAIIGPTLAPHDYANQELSDARIPPPDATYPLGTDALGRDVLSRLLKAIQVSVFVGLGTTAIALVIGTIVGLIAGYHRGKVDTVLNGLTEMFWGFPLILIAVIIIGVIGPGLTGVITAVAFINWAAFARVVRGETLGLREREFVVGARALGKSDIHIMFRHILPNTMPAVLVMASFYVAFAIIAEAGLSFIGLGAQEPLPSLGQMVSDGRDLLLTNHWLSTIPGLTIVLLILSLNALGDGLRDIFDPRLRTER
jgi:ABC-type dipeptide/oligopeptide/nickel transport system permease subunit